MNIAMGSDHRGLAMARSLAAWLEGLDHVLTLCAPDHDQAFSKGMERTSDYPDYAWPVARAVVDGQADLGVLICGTGMGMAIAANKVPGIRAVTVHDEIAAKTSRLHNNANILCLGGDVVSADAAPRILDVWLRTSFEGGRHARRIEKIARMEAGLPPRSHCLPPTRPDAPQDPARRSA